MTPLERATRALCEASGINPDGPGSEMDPWTKNWQHHERQVRAVLRAIRQPDEAMLDAAGEVFISTRDPKGNCLGYWQAMIDAALQEGM